MSANGACGRACAALPAPAPAPARARRSPAGALPPCRRCDCASALAGCLRSRPPRASPLRTFHVPCAERGARAAASTTCRCGRAGTRSSTTTLPTQVRRACRGSLSVCARTHARGDFAAGDVTCCCAGALPRLRHSRESSLGCQKVDGPRRGGEGGGVHRVGRGCRRAPLARPACTRRAWAAAPSGAACARACAPGGGTAGVHPALTGADVRAAATAAAAVAAATHVPV